MYLKVEEMGLGKSLEEEQRIFQEKMNRVISSWVSLRVTILESKAIWGNEAEDSFKEIGEVVKTLKAGVWLHFWLKGAYAGPGVMVDNNPERVDENNRVVFRISDDDEFSKKIRNAVNNVEEFFKTKIR